MTAVGEEIEGSIKNNLREAITGAQSFGEAMRNVLNKIRDKIIDAQLDRLFDGFLKDDVDSLFVPNKISKSTKKN